MVYVTLCFHWPSLDNYLAGHMPKHYYLVQKKSHTALLLLNLSCLTLVVILKYKEWLFMNCTNT